MSGPAPDLDPVETALLAAIKVRCTSGDHDKIMRADAAVAKAMSEADVERIRILRLSTEP